MKDLDWNIKKLDQIDPITLFKIFKSRVDVFVVEQECPYPEIDDIDLQAYHLYIVEDNNIHAYLRIFESDGLIKIGRVLTNKENRGRGLGYELMSQALNFCKRKYPNNDYYLEAQEYAISFYEKFAFKVISDVFLEDNIPHVKMLKKNN